MPGNDPLNVQMEPSASGVLTVFAPFFVTFSFFYSLSNKLFFFFHFCFVVWCCCFYVCNFQFIYTTFFSLPFHAHTHKKVNSLFFAAIDDTDPVLYMDKATVADLLSLANVYLQLCTCVCECCVCARFSLFLFLLFFISNNISHPRQTRKFCWGLHLI